MSTTVSKRVSVLLVDDHRLFRAGLRLLVESRPNLEVVGEAGNYAEARAISISKQPDLILLDLDLGNENGLDFIRELLIVAPNARTLIVTGTRDLKVLMDAIRQGARGVIQKDQEPEMVLTAIEKVHQGEIWFDSTLLANMLTKLHSHDAGNGEQAKLKTLTKRERQIISLVCQGLKNQQIATQLFISEGTVRNYLTIIYQKLGVHDRFGMIVFANRSGLGIYAH